MKPAFAAAAWTVAIALFLNAVCAGAQTPEAPRLGSDDLFLNPRRSFNRFDDFVYTARERQQEAQAKVERLRRAMARKKIDALVIGAERNFGWLTAGGRDDVVLAQRESPVKLIVTPDRLVLLANNIEGPRVMTEELNGLGYSLEQFAWHEDEAAALSRLLKGKRAAFDLPATAAQLRADVVGSVSNFDEVYFPVTAGELKKYRWLGKKTAEILEQTAEVVTPGMTERDVQYLLCREFWYWDIVPTVVLSSADERYITYRHPIVRGEPVKRYIALNVCARRWGLVVSTNRLIHFGEMEPGLARAWEVGPAVCAAVWAATRPGEKLGSVFEAARRAYREAGFPDEWRLHHQGGPILTQERLFLVRPGDETRIVPGMVLAWNPTLQGAKFEDTVVVREDGTIENLTFPEKSRWPARNISAAGRSFRVPLAQVREAPSQKRP